MSFKNASFQLETSKSMLFFYCYYISFQCYILTLDGAVSQRCTCVNKRKKKRKQWDVMKEYRQMPAAVESVGDRKTRVRASLQIENSPQQLPVEQPQPRCGRSAKWVLEDNTACYGQEKKLGQYSSLSLSLSPLISHTPQKHQPLREKSVRDTYYYKQVCLFVHRSS